MLLFTTKLVFGTTEVTKNILIEWIRIKNELK